MLTRDFLALVAAMAALFALAIARLPPLPLPV
jgi:hypothetical protein